MKKCIPILLLLAAILTGCGGNAPSELPEVPEAVCFAVANTACSQGLNLSSPLVREYAEKAVAGYGFVSVVSIDGAPEILMADSFDIPEKYKQASRDKLEKDALANTAALLDGLQGILANDAEADYLAGLQLAARSLSGLDSYGEKTILMVGTGLSTAGTLDFRNNLLLAEPEAVLDQLEALGEIPELGGITVIWQQMGDTAAPQEPLTQHQKERLREIWRGIVERGGGTFRCSDMIPVPQSTGDFPPVTPVELPEREPICFQPEIVEAGEPDLFREPILLTEKQVTFVGDRAEYLHPEEAAQVIAPIADFLTRNPEVQILLVGTTAGDQTNAYTLELSLARADAVRSTLAGMGIAEDRIRTLGMGASDPWHIAGAGTEGELASANRKVVILDAAGDAAAELLKQ